MCVSYHKYSEATRNYRTLMFTITAKGKSFGFLRKHMVSSFWKYGQSGVHTQSKLRILVLHTNITNNETAYCSIHSYKDTTKGKPIANTQNC